MVPILDAMGHRGPMRPSSGPPHSRARILTELYLRAYWRYYLLACVWCIAITATTTAFPHR